MVISAEVTGILPGGFIPIQTGVVSDSTTSGVVLIIGVFVNAFVFLYKGFRGISVLKGHFPEHIYTN